MPRWKYTLAQGILLATGGALLYVAASSLVIWVECVRAIWRDEAYWPAYVVAIGGGCLVWVPIARWAWRITEEVEGGSS